MDIRFGRHCSEEDVCVLEQDSPQLCLYGVDLHGECHNLDAHNPSDTTPRNFEERLVCEEMVDSHIRERLKISYLEVPLGRKELEEYIHNFIDSEVKLNKRGKRKF